MTFIIRVSVWFNHMCELILKKKKKKILFLQTPKAAFSCDLLLPMFSMGGGFEDNNVPSLQDWKMWGDSVGEIQLAPFFFPVPHQWTLALHCAPHACNQLWTMACMEMLRKYSNAECVCFSKTKRRKKMSNAAHTQQINWEIQTPAVQSHSAKAHIKQMLQFSTEVLEWSWGEAGESFITLQQCYEQKTQCIQS